MPCQECLCCLCICPDAYAHQYLSKLNLIDFEYFGALDQMCFFGTAESFQFRVKIADKHDIVREVFDGFEKPKVGISIPAVNGSQN